MLDYFAKFWIAFDSHINALNTSVCLYTYYCMCRLWYLSTIFEFQHTVLSFVPLHAFISLLRSLSSVSVFIWSSVLPSFLQSPGHQNFWNPTLLIFFPIWSLFYGFVTLANILGFLFTSLVISQHILSPYQFSFQNLKVVSASN